MMETTTSELETFAGRLAARVVQGKPDGYEPESLDARVQRTGLDFHLAFVPEGKLLIVARHRPAHCLLLCAESSLTQDLDRLGILGEVKIGDPDFDARYVVKNCGQAEARATMSAGFLATLRDLEPFLEFEMTLREYRLLKPVDASYGADRLARDLDSLAQLVTRSRAPEEAE
ncbi:MAG: hypothetical protein AB1758_16330 [Candidatus Eremiobacterota bacterium]